MAVSALVAPIDRASAAYDRNVANDAEEQVDAQVARASVLMAQSGKSAYEAVSTLAACGQPGAAEADAPSEQLRLDAIRRDLEAARDAALDYLNLQPTSSPAKDGAIRVVEGIHASDLPSKGDLSVARAQARAIEKAISDGYADYGAASCGGVNVSCGNGTSGEPEEHGKVRLQALDSVKKVLAATQSVDTARRCKKAREALDGIGAKAQELRPMLGGDRDLPAQMAIDPKGGRSYKIEGRSYKFIQDLSHDVGDLLPEELSRRVEHRPASERGIVLEAIVEFYSRSKTNRDGKLSDAGRQRLESLVTTLVDTFDATSPGEIESTGSLGALDPESLAALDAELESTDAVVAQAIEARRKAAKSAKSGGGAGSFFKGIGNWVGGLFGGSKKE